MDTFTDQQRRLFLCVIYLFPALLQEISALRCYECNPSSGYSVAGTFSSSSSSSGPAGAFGSSSSSSDCYSPDTRQIKDCAWDIQSCYTVVLPGPQTGIGGAPYTPLQPQGQFGVSQNIPYGNPYTANSGLIVQRGCGKYPGVYEVGDEECRVVTLPGTQTRATVCNCRSDSCNSRRPDQVQNPLTGQSTITTGFYPNAPPSSGPYDPSRQPMGGGGAYQPIGGVGGVYQPPGGPYVQPGQFAYGSGYYPNNQLQPGAQYPFQQYPSTAYGPQQQPGYYNAPVGQPNYNPGYVAGPAPYGPGYAPGQQVPNQYQGGGIGTDPYAYPGRYGGAAALTKPWALCVSTLLLIAVAAGCIR